MSRQGSAPDETTDRPAGQPRAAGGEGARKRYQRPLLQSYGRLLDVTRFGGSQTNDSMSNLGQL